MWQIRMTRPSRSQLVRSDDQTGSLSAEIVNTHSAAGKLVGKILRYTYTLYFDASIHASIFAHLFPFIFDKELQPFR